MTMRVWYGYREAVAAPGHYKHSGWVEGTSIQIMKQLLCALHSGEKKLCAMDDLFTEYYLDAYTPNELVKWIAEFAAFDTAAQRVLKLHEVVDDPTGFWTKVATMVNTIDIDHILQSSPNQTILLIKVL